MISSYDLLKYEGIEDKEGLSWFKSNLGIFSDFRTAAACGPYSGILTTSNEESLNTKVVDLFELYNFGIELALIGLYMRKLWSKY